MKHTSLILSAIMLTLLASGTASAQFIPPGGSQFNPPMSAAPPPPKIEVPAIPQMDAPPSQPSISVAPSTSFGERIGTCLDDAAAAGLDQAGRAAYSRSCANR
jgi:hypothetical protein